MYTHDTIGDVNRLLESDKSFFCEKDRIDLTGLEIFTIDPSNARDLDDALSIEELDDTYRVGVHIADVTFYVEKDSHIDKEAYERATTFYPGKCMNAHKMLPSPLINMLFSLIPGERSSKHHFKEKETTTIPDSLCKQIRGLFNLAKKLRVSRLGSGLFYSPIEKLDEDDDVIDTKEAHYLVEEFMILANITIGEFLLNKYKNCIPLRVQLPPKPEHVKAWLESYECSADLILKLQEIRPSPVLWHDRKLTIDNTSTENLIRHSCISIGALRWGHKLFKEPQIVHGFVKTVSENEVSVVVPGFRSLPQSSKTIQLNSLNAVNKPAFKTDTLTGREILELIWKKRLYSFNGYTLTQTKETKQDGYRLNPHSRGFFQKLRKWKVILEDFTSDKSQKRQNEKG
ncbi:unnamed protein product [Mytilus edulis]|uniref:RNB domain-containing protein n=1 Tax=Mytilus edulis TaxID=6550 RepID=A0A8S3V0Z3_MYTED|nr:unnamed protein product [Mytilus edulis]